MARAIFYMNKSDDRKVDKSLTEISTSTVTYYKRDTNVMDPVITVNMFADFQKCNYVYLEDFQRYYFIRSITVSQQSIILDLHIDVLKTYGAQIRSQKAIVKRQQDKRKANFYLDDDKYKALEYSRIQCKAFSGGFNTNAFVLTVAGGR